MPVRKKQWISWQREKKVKDRDKRKLLPGAAAAAAAASIVVYLLLLHVEAKVLGDYERVAVWAAEKEIEEGTLLTRDNLADYARVVWLEKALFAEGMLTEELLIKEAMSTGKILKGTILTAAMMEETDELTKGIREPVVAGVKGEDLFQMVSGRLRSGDRIHIYLVEEEMGEIRKSWENVLVYQVFDSSGREIDASDRTTAAGRINIIMDKEEAEIFYGGLAKGSVRAVRVWK